MESAKKHRNRRIWIGVATGLIVPILVLVLSLNVIVKHVLTSKIDHAISETDSLCVKYGSLEIDIRTGKLAIHNVVFQTDTIFDDTIRAFSRLEMTKVALDGVDYYSLLVERCIDLKGITIEGVHYNGILDTKAMEARAATDDINKATKEQFDKLLKEAQKHLRRVTLERLTIKETSADIETLETGLQLKISNLGIEVYDLGYSLVDTLIPFHYNDSAMKLQLKYMEMVMPDSMMNLHVGKLYTLAESRGIVICGIHFATANSEQEGIESETKEYHEVGIDTIKFEGIDVPDMRKKKSLIVGSVRIINGEYYGNLKEAEKEKKKKKIDFAKLGVKTEEAQFFAELKQKQEEVMSEQQIKMLKMVQNWLDAVKVDYISIENANVNILSHESELAIGVDDINVAFNNLGYSLIDSIPYHFNDSTYKIGTGKIAVTTADGKTTIESKGFEHSNCGPISVGETHIEYIDKTEMMMDVDTFFTSKVSPFSTVLDRRLLLDSVYIRVSNLDLYVDNRHIKKPKFEMPSKETLLEIKKLYKIGNITVAMDKMRTEVTGHKSNNGIITVEDATVSLNDIYFNNLNVGNFDALFPDGDIRLKIGNIHTIHKKHNLVVQDIMFQTNNKSNGKEPYHMLKVDSIVVGGMELDNAYTSKNIGASVLRIVHPQYYGEILMKEENENAQNKKETDQPKKKEYNRQQNEEVLDFVKEWLDYAQMQRIRIERASADIRAINSGFSMKTHDFNLALSGIGFNIDRYIPINLADSTVDIGYFIDNFRLLGNSAISHIGFRDLHATLPDSSMYINVERVYTNHRSNSVVLNNLEFATDTIVPIGEMYHKVTADTIRIDGIVLPDLKEQREAMASALRVIRPHYFGLIDERKKDKEVHEIKTTETDELGREKYEKAMKVVKEFFDGAALNMISIEDASAEFGSLVSGLSGKAEGIDLSLNEISYEITDKVYEIEQVPGLRFNDSIYSVAIRHANITIPDTTLSIVMNNFKHENCGPVSIGRTKAWHTIDKWEIAKRNGEVPTTWFSMVLDTFRTSFVHPMNIFQDYKKMGSVKLDSVVAVVDTLTIFRDMRYKPKKPYHMPQEPMLKIDSTIASAFAIRTIDAKVNKMNIEMAMTDKCVPKMELENIWGNVNNVSLARGSNINITGGATLGGGKAILDANIGVSEECPWDVTLDASEINLEFLNDLVFPIAGLNVSGKIRRLQATYGGDNNKADGTMQMTYNDLQAVFQKESPSPYKMIGKNYRFLNSAAKTLLSHNNPKHPGGKVRAYKVKWKNDPWSPSAVFMMGPIIHGAIESLLPWLFIGNRL